MDSQDSTVPALILRTDDSEINKITPLDCSPFLIGRGSECSLKVRPICVSRKQCSIERIGSNWMIRSLGSRPVTVDGNVLFGDSSKTLKCSDIIELPGFIEFEFKCSPDQNGHCCGDAEAENSVIICNDSPDFAVPMLNSLTSSRPSTPNLPSIDEPPSDGSSSVVEVQSYNTDGLVNVEVISNQTPVKPSLCISLDLGLLMDTDQLTELILTFANHLEGNDGLEMIDTNYSRFFEELRLRLEYIESMEKYGIDESCEAHERNGNIGRLFDAVKKLSSVLDEKRIGSPESRAVVGTRSNESLERLFLPIDIELINKTKELVNVLNNLPDSSKTSMSNDVPAASEKKMPRVCCCKQRNRKVTPKKRKEPVSDDASDHTDDENDARKKVKWQEARIEYLQMKLKEKEKESSQLESTKKENDNLMKRIAELKRTLSKKDVMELEFKVLQETVKYKEEDKRSKDILQEQIDSLKSENTDLKILYEKLGADLEKMKNENAEMMEKYKKLEEKSNEKTNLLTELGTSRDGTAGDHCCEVGAARTFSLIELLESELNCSICGELFIEPTVTNCNHTFCSHCLREWKKMKRECPFCRTIVVRECKISFLDELINKILKLLSPKLLEERLHLVQERVAPPVQPPPAKRPRARARQTARVPRNSRGPYPYLVNPEKVQIQDDRLAEHMNLRKFKMELEDELNSMKEQ